MRKKLQEKRLLSVVESAEYLDCHPDTVRRHLKAGSIPSMKLGRVVRVSRIALDELISTDAKLPTPPKRTASDPANGDA